MTERLRKVVIAGAGQAGATAALELRRAGYDGELTLVGEESHLPYERPQLSKDLLLPGAGALRSFRDAGAYERERIRLLLGNPIERVDAGLKRVELRDGTALDYDRLLIATGVRPRRLPMQHDERVRYLRNVEDALALRGDFGAIRTLAVIGGGVIGLEVAAAARARDIAVVVIESAVRLMARSVDAHVAQFLDRTHRARGVDIRYGVQVAQFGTDATLLLSDGSSVRAERVLVGIGVVPNIEPFAHLGITDALGVRVDECGRTAIDSIYAAGDVASQPGAHGHARVETWANAQDHAVAVARNLLGAAQPYRAPTWFWSDQGPTNLQVVGDATQGTCIVRGDAQGERFSVFRLDAEHRLAGCAAINSPKDMAQARRWVKQASTLDPERLANPSIPLRDCEIAAASDDQRKCA